MPTLTINGRKVTVPEGTNLIEAAKSIGLLIPHFCYHKYLTVVGQCRQCLVEVEKAPKLVTACSTIAAEAMVVHTDTPLAREGARSVLEFELVNHPKDCPICDQAGECYLQDYYMETGRYPSVLTDPKNLKHKVIDLGAGIMLDTERCILCTRCVRFMREVAKTGELTVLHRGDRAEIASAPGHELQSLYAGNVVDICPVGALTSEDFRFRKRVWFLSSTPTICPDCSMGCNVLVDHEGGVPYRLRPRENPDVNVWWMCDRGRQAYKEVRSAERVQTPLLRDGGVLRRGSWPEALQRTAEALSAAANAGEERVVLVGSPRRTIEEHFALRELGARWLGGSIPYVGLAPRDRAEADGFLLQAERVPNWPGLDRAGLADARRDWASLEQRLADAPPHVLLVVEEDLAALWAGAAREALDRVPCLIVLASRFHGTAARAHVVLPMAGWAEMDGTFVNVQGRLQLLRAVVPPPGEAIPVWEVVRRLLAAAGHDPGWSAAAGIFDEAARALPALSGLSHAAVGERGIPIADASRSARAGGAAA